MEPVLVIYSEGEPVRVTGRWEGGNAVFEEFVPRIQGFHRLEIIIDGEARPLTTNVTYLWPQDTFTVLADGSS